VPNVVIFGTIVFFLIIWVLRITVIAKYQREDSSKI